MAGTAISAVGLTKRYGDFTAVDSLNLVVGEGEIFGLLGPNGAGKTTTILMLLGLSEPTSGTASVSGLSPTRQPLDVKRVVGYVPDNVGFYSDLTGRQNLEYTARLNRMDKAEYGPRIAELMDQVGLSDSADKPSGTYSRGMRQRLGIADALVKNPRLLILDEPTIGIDPEGLREILDLIRALREDSGVTVLLSSHLLHQVQSICDRVGIFVKGKMVAEGPVRELAARLKTSGATIEVAVDDWSRAGDVMYSIPGVTRIDRGEDHWVISADTDLRPQIVKALSERGIGLLHLALREEALDVIYMNYFGRDGRDS